MRLTRRNLLLNLLTICLVVAFLELTLTLLTDLSPHINRLLSPHGEIIADERLGHRLNPNYPGHDGKGFRNEKIVTNADIVTLGDSQTHGSHVPLEDTWPMKLASLAQASVYSMAVPGYGPAHSLTLWSEAIDLQPKLILEGFYSGNDLYDSFNLVYNMGQLPELKSSDAEVKKSIQNAEAEETIAERVRGMRERGQTTRNDEETASIRRYLALHSRLYQLLRRIRYEIRRSGRKLRDSWEDAKSFAERNSAYMQVFDDGHRRTVFTSERRLSALNLGDPRIVEGKWISLKAIELMSKQASAKNVRFIVVLIPTKELVFAEISDVSTPSYRSLLRNEAKFWRTTKDYLAGLGIEYVDTLPALREQLSTGTQPYEVSHNGHPNAQGHLAIAGYVLAKIQSSVNFKQIEP